MNYLLDTCVLSEFTRRRPSASVVAWMEQIEEHTLYLSVISIGEIQRGIQRLPGSPRRDELSAWLAGELLPRFEQRLLVLDAPVLLAWGGLLARLEKEGHPMPAMDALIAATALSYNLILVTRNTADFQASGIPLFNPWE